MTRSMLRTCACLGNHVIIQEVYLSEQIRTGDQLLCTFYVVDISMCKCPFAMERLIRQTPVVY